MGPGASPQGLPPGSPSTPGSAASRTLRSPPRAALSPAERAGDLQKHTHPSAGNGTVRAPQYPAGASSRHFHLSGPARGARPPRGRMVVPASPQPGGTRPLRWRVRHGTSTHTRGPPRTPAVDGSSQPPRGRTMAGAKSRLVPTFARLPPLPGASLPPPPSPAARPCSLPRDWRPPTRKCPDVTPPLWKPSPPPPLPQG